MNHESSSSSYFSEGSMIKDQRILLQVEHLHHQWCVCLWAGACAFGFSIGELTCLLGCACNFVAFDRPFCASNASSVFVMAHHQSL